MINNYNYNAETEIKQLSNRRMSKMVYNLKLLKKNKKICALINSVIYKLFEYGHYH